MSHPPPSSHGPRPETYERRDVAVRPILFGALIGLLLVILAAVGARWVVSLYAARDAASSSPANPLRDRYARQLPPEPRLQTHPVADLKTLRATEDAALSRYGWIDRKAGIVRVPIERAMELLIERGVAARPPAEGER